MAKNSKRFKELLKKVDTEKNYSIDEAISTLKTLASAQFDETIELALKLNVDPRHAEQMVRGSVVLPAGTGNDFSREMNFTNSIPTFMERLENEVVSTLELLSFNEKLSHTTGIAMNSLGFGLDAAICQLNTIQSKKQKSKFGLSKFSYLTPIINAFKKHKEFQASIQINGQPVQISDKNLLVGLFNHSYFGGGIRFVPTAKQNSHNFEVVVARDVTASVILKAFPFILWNKQHFERFPENLLKQTATHACIKIQEPILMQTDGEVYSFEEVELEAKLITYPIYLT